MEFAPFSGIDNADLNLIFPKENDTVCDEDGNEWLFYGNEWSLCGEGLSWQLPDQDENQLPDQDENQDPLDYPPYDYDYDT